MSPRRFINVLRSPSGALALFILGLIVLLVMVNSRRSAIDPSAQVATTPIPKRPLDQQVSHVVDRPFAPFNPPSPLVQPSPTPISTKSATTKSVPALPPISLVAEQPNPEREPKSISAHFAPFGRLIPCELVITVDSSSINTPIVGLVTEDVFHHGQLVVAAGTEIHGTATVDRTRERIASDGRWTLVWQNGDELSVSGLALDRDFEDGSWALTDGSAGLRGRLLKTDNLAEVKLYAAALLSGAANVFTDKSTSAFGTFTLPSLQNAPLKGAQAVLDRYAQQISDAIQRDGFYVRVPAGKQFYLYVTQTLDQGDAKIGGHAVEPSPASSPASASHAFSPAVAAPSLP